MFDLVVTIDAADFERAVAEGLRTLDAEMSEAVKQAVDAGAEKARNDHPYANRTGKLEKSTRGYMEARHQGVIEADTDYAQYVEYGTSRSRPYPFMEPAERVANAVLEVELERAVGRMEDVINRR